MSSWPTLTSAEATALITGRPPPAESKPPREMTNWGAIHRQRRRNAEPQRRSQSGALIENCVAIDCGGDGFHIEGGDVTIRGSSSIRNGGAGLYVGNRARVGSSHSIYRDNAGGDVQNHGEFDDIENHFGPS